MLSLITNERNPDRLAGFPHGMNAQGCCWGGLEFFFFFFSTSQSEYLHLFESIPLPSKILVLRVNAYLGKGLRLRADLRGSSWMLNPWWIGNEVFVCKVGATAGQSLLWLYQCLCRVDQDQQEKWRHPMVAGTRVTGSVSSDVGSSSVFLKSWIGVWAVGPLFFSFREDESTFIEKFELDSNVGWEHICGGVKQIHPGLHTTRS